MTATNKLNLIKNKTGIQDWALILISLLILKECTAIVSALNVMFYPAGLIAGAVFLGFSGYVFGQLYKRMSKINRTVAFLMSGMSIVLLFTDAGTANAQFLKNAEDFFTTGAATFGLGTQVTLLVSLIFWIIRGAFVIGVAIALLPAIQAAREGDEWRSLAKTPMLVAGIALAGATSVDFLVAATP